MKIFMSEVGKLFTSKYRKEYLLKMLHREGFNKMGWKPKYKLRSDLVKSTRRADLWGNGKLNERLPEEFCKPEWVETRRKSSRKAHQQKGNVVEKIVIDHLRELHFKVTDCQKVALLDVAGIHLVGFIDGIIEIDGKKMLLEIKSRCGKSKHQQARISELVQIHLYMRALRKMKLNSCIFIEECGGRLEAFQIDYSEEFLNRTLINIHSLI